MKIEEVTSGVSGGRKKKNPKMIILIVGGIVVVLLVLMRKSQPASSDAPTAAAYADNYDQLGEYFQNNTGMISGQVDGQIQTALATMTAQLESQSGSIDSQLKQTVASLEAQNTGQLNDYFSDLGGYLKERDDASVKALEELRKQNEKLMGDLSEQQKLDKAQAEALKKLQDAAKKKPTTPPKDPEKAIKSQPTTPFKPGGPKTVPVKTIPKPKPVPTIKANYKGNSIVDALKSAGVNSSMANRDKIAEKNGIKNYTGTAAQNTALLKKAKAGTLKK